ncbi:MAG: hypothetical protein ABIR50_04280 [Ginsengibacter sp.]
MSLCSFNYFNRISNRNGNPAAISAITRKLTIIVWIIIVKGVQFKPENNYEFLDQKRKRKVQEMKKLIHKFDVKTNELGLQCGGL